MDLAIFSTRIFTGDPAQPWAEALGIRNNQIVAVGTNEEVKKVCQRGTLMLELPGRLVTPGLVDGHCHFVNFGLTLQMVNLQNLPSLATCRERIQQAAASRQPGDWIIGRGWNHHQWAERREPTRHDLDDLIPNNPAMMIRACGHSVWVNSLALSRTAITRQTPDPPGGRIERDPRTGEPTGLLREARDLVLQQIPPPTLEERKRAALAAQREALRYGITGVHSCETLQQWEALAALEEEGKLKLRVHHLLPAAELVEAATRQIKPGQGSERLWFSHVKLFADGSLGSGTALLHEPYTDDPAQRGIAVLTPEALQQKIQLAYQQGWEVAIHAIGDQALTNALGAIAAARKIYPGIKRDRLEHVQLFRPQDLPLLRDLGVVASVQPVHVTTDWPIAEKRWGQPRCRYAYAWKSLLRAGIRLQFGSDAPVEPINPLLGMQAAVTRQSTQGEPPGGWFPEEKLSLEQSIQGFTLLSSWTSHRESHLGTLAGGKWADLTIFNQDLFGLPPDCWSSVEVEMTVVHGGVVYQKGK